MEDVLGDKYSHLCLSQSVHDILQCSHYIKTKTDRSLGYLTCDIHKLVEVSFTEECFIQSPEVTLEDPGHRVDMVGIVHPTEGIAVVLEILLELGNIRLQSLSEITPWTGRLF